MAPKLRALRDGLELEGFATCHLENLPTGLARLEAAIEDQDGETRARREEKERKRAERAVLAAGVPAATADATASFAVDSAAAKTGKKKAQRAKKLREEKEKKAKKKLEDERRRREAEDGEGVRSELATGGAHLDVAEVLGEVVAVLGTSERCQKAASALRTKGHIHQRACVKCGKRNEDFRDDVDFDELARSAPAAALVHAARSDGGSVADVFREAHAHAAKSCDACRAPGACEVDVVLEHAAKALVLSLAWYSTDQEGDDVAALLELVWRDARLPAKRVFSSIGKVKFEVDLFAVAVFQNAHYTAFVRARDGSDSWTYHDRRSAVAVGSFANVVQRCRDGPMLPYLLFYDSLAAAPGA